MKKTEGYEPYYVPEESIWPIVGSTGLATFVTGIVGLFHQSTYGIFFFILGASIITYMLVGWFGNVIHESQKGLYSKQMDMSFRWGMIWFIFSEVMFFGAFFGDLFYCRQFSVPWLAGEGGKAVSHMFWENFRNVWPLLSNPDNTLFVAPKHVISAWGLPVVNTLLLLTSGVTITLAHHALKESKRPALNFWLFCTYSLGLIFLVCQVTEYSHAYSSEVGLTLNSGIYGTTFFLLTGFHGIHVTLGSLMLFVIWCRCVKGHFTPEKHFGFEAVAWYWHFVDVVWLLLFIFVYII
jgi:cytochrome c oxidase subunit 3